MSPRLTLSRASVGTTVAGSYLNAATAQEPVAVLGADAAQRLGIDRIFPASECGSAASGFTSPAFSRPPCRRLRSTVSIILGFPAAERYLGFDGHPTTVYVRGVTSQVAAVLSVLAATANPEAPNEVDVSQYRPRRGLCCPPSERPACHRPERFEPSETLASAVGWELTPRRARPRSVPGSTCSSRGSARGRRPPRPRAAREC